MLVDTPCMSSRDARRYHLALTALNTHLVVYVSCCYNPCKQLCICLTIQEFIMTVHMPLTFQLLLSLHAHAGIILSLHAPLTFRHVLSLYAPLTCRYYCITTYMYMHLCVLSLHAPLTFRHLVSLYAPFIFRNYCIIFNIQALFDHYMPL